MAFELCDNATCLLKKGHDGAHQNYPTSAWGFLNKKDCKKINKAGFATPRGGKKGAYQNHVTRSNKVIVPYERFDNTNLSAFKDDYIIRLYPQQCFEAKNKINPILSSKKIKVGQNAFVLYRTYEQFESLPPLKNWKIRWLKNKENDTPVERRGKDVEDMGEYVLRLTKKGDKPERVEGPPQGIFAPEYADEQNNYQAKCFLAWLIVRTEDSPYTSSQLAHLEAILSYYSILDKASFEEIGLTRNGLTSCPLCLKNIIYEEFHSPVEFDGEEALGNAAIQIADSTRSTVVNLFHIRPLSYEDVSHDHRNIAWGHATCNTKLGQRRCHSLTELIGKGKKVGILEDGMLESFGWISDNGEMIRSPLGAVWIRLHKDYIDPTAANLNHNKGE